MAQHHLSLDCFQRISVPGSAAQHPASVTRAENEIQSQFPMSRITPTNLVGQEESYDGSIIVERTKGEIAARCDKEDANFLAINLADDIANGRRSVEDARKFYAESMMVCCRIQRKSEITDALLREVRAPFR